MDNLRFYYAAGACSLASHIALEEAGAAFEPVRVKFAEGEQRSPSYKNINPKGRVPALARGDWVLTENPAILRFIAVSWPAAGLWPPEPERDARCAEWLAWLSSGVHVAYAHISRAERYATTDACRRDVISRGQESCREAWLAVERKLGEGPWATGETYSVADPYLFVIWTWGRLPTSPTRDDPPIDLDHAVDLPNWTAHARRVAERPAVRRALAREDLVFP